MPPGMGTLGIEGLGRVHFNLPGLVARPDRTVAQVGATVLDRDARPGVRALRPTIGLDPRQAAAEIKGRRLDVRA